MSKRGVQEAPPASFFFIEMGIEIAMPFEHIQNLEDVTDIAKKDYIAAICKAAHIVSQFRPPTAHLTRQSCWICTFAAQLASKLQSDFRTAALARDKYENVKDVILRIGRITKPSHLITFVRQFCGFGFQGHGKFLIGDIASAGD